MGALALWRLREGAHASKGLSWWKTVKTTEMARRSSEKPSLQLRCKVQNLLGPFPVKSSASITSACTEFFFPVFPLLRAFSVTAFPESCEYERRDVGAAAFFDEGGGTLEE